MNAVFLACCLCCAQAPDNDPLLKQLDSDFEALVKAEKDPQPLREAARLLAATDSSSNWTNYSSVTTLLRRSRARAAVPLLLAYLVRHGDPRRFNSHIYIPAYVGVLELLTGKEIGPLYRSGGGIREVRAAVERLVNDWWKPHKDNITTDIGKMTDEQAELVTARLLVQAARSSEGATTLTARDVHPRMIPLILARTGYLDGDQAKQPPRRDTYQIPQEAVPILATLRKDGEAPELDKIAADARQNSATRLLCLMALSRAGEDIPLANLVGLLEKEKKLDRRLRMIQMIGALPDAHKAASKLLTLLDDPNTQ
ncbi:MAG: hypothetical protein L0Z62_17650, partial [Gemmataceae bacterium]|nr:hypothetical protein [Gemmataceae bacterium]